jgi:hypothetical protein
MPRLDLLSYLFGGAFLANAVPHLVGEMTRRPFRGPFAKPPGEDISSTANMLSGFTNLVLDYAPVCRVGHFDLRHTKDVAAPGLGLFSAHHFGRFHGSNTLERS